MRRGLPTDGSSAREVRIRKAAPSARARSGGSSSAPWWYGLLLWALLLATLPLVNLKAAPVAANAGVTVMLSPFIAAADAGVSLARSRGSGVPTGETGWPRIWARAFGSSLYAFLGLWLSYRMALRFAQPGAALLATVAIWLASSLPLYVYVQPFSSPGAAMFAAALVLTVWLWVRAGSSRARWLCFGLAGGLAVLTSPFSAALLMVAFFECVSEMTRPRGFVPALMNLVMFAAGGAALLAPAAYFASQSIPAVHWADAQLWAATFSMEHGAFVWTPVLLIAALGLGLAVRRQPALGALLLISAALFVYLVAVLDDSSAAESGFGNSHLVPLIPVFACGLAALVDSLAGRRGRVAWASTVSGAALLVVWNLGLMLQWGTGLIPRDQPLDIRQAAVNQWTVVPPAAKGFVIRYMNERKGLVSELEGGTRE